MSLRSKAICFLIAGTTLVGASSARAAVAVDVTVAPPTPRVVAVPPPRAGYVWADGYWRWNGHRHVWVDGHWVHARPGWRWVPDHWVAAGPRWHFVPGRWVRV